MLNVLLTASKKKIGLLNSNSSYLSTFQKKNISLMDKPLDTTVLSKVWKKLF